MNKLTKFLVKELLGKPSIVALYGGGFKPPTKGHFNVIEKTLEQFPEIDNLKILVGGGVRDGITQNESIDIWNIYKKYLSNIIDIEPSIAPVKSILGYAKENPNTKIYWILGAREGDDEDLKDIAERTKSLGKYPNIEVKVITTVGGVSGTKTRASIKSGNKEQFFHLIPDVSEEEKEQIWDMVIPVIKEGFIEDIKTKFNKFISAVKQESKETKEALSLLIKAAKGDIELSDKQKEQIGNQLKDVLKLVGLTAIAALPGGFIAGALIKLFKAESLITPSSFVNEVNIHQKALSQTEKEALELTYKNWDTFGGKECNNGFCDIFAKNLSKYLPGSKIMSTEDPRNETLGHVWVEYEGKYFDAETPNGVDSWKQLPWMIEFYSKNKSYPTDIENLNEVGEANLKPYKWEEVDREGYYVYTRFTTDSETQYDVDLKTTTYIDNDLNNLRALEIEFTAKPKGAEGSSAKIVVNKGEMYKVMSTIVDIVKKYIKKSKSQAILYSPSKKSSEEDFGTQRDNLYRAFISKAFPGAKFEQEGEIVVAILPDTINELVTDTEVICDNCGWEWPIADGGKDLYVCHKCGHDNNPKNDPFGLNELARNFVKEVLKEALIETWKPEESFVSLSKYMIDNGMNIKPLPKIKVISDDEDNASNLLGKTAYYNPADKSITLYTMDRHPKDILRSFSHEMIHHEQNLEGRLNNINTTNTNEDGDLPEIEKEAYEKGNMMLRNWEDSIKNV